jgi:3-phenylpropionate/trans-cinnamate dioxygenase ferredoxin subunit
MALRVRLCHVDDVPEGQIRGFEAPGVDKPILVARIGDEFHVTASICPHEEVSLLRGRLDGTAIVCPGHGWEFSLRTGECGHLPWICLPVYRTEIIDDILYCELI